MAHRRTEAIRYAADRGWDYVVRPGGHLCFTKAGYKVFAAMTSSDVRATKNFQADIRRFDRQIEQLSQMENVTR